MRSPASVFLAMIPYKKSFPYARAHASKCKLYSDRDRLVQSDLKDFFITSGYRSEILARIIPALAQTHLFNIKMLSNSTSKYIIFNENDIFKGISKINKM